VTRPIELPRPAVAPVVRPVGGSAAAQLVARLEQQLRDASQATGVDVRA
jgi:hypothetical protein